MADDPQNEGTLSNGGGGELSAAVTVFGDELEWEADISVVEGQPTGLLQLDPFVSGYLGRLSGWQLEPVTADSDWNDCGTTLRDMASRWCGHRPTQGRGHSARASRSCSQQSTSGAAHLTRPHCIAGGSRQASAGR